MEIKEKEKYNASVSANYFNDKNTRNRAYINTLGAEFILRYLADEGINISDIHNIHSIRKILGELDIADIMLHNIHIDVRVIFDENAIFIPKSHFKYDILPDIYIVVKPENNYSNAEILGFFEPKLINKNNANKDYYFIEKEKLSPVSEIKNYIQNSNNNTNRTLSEDELSEYENLIMSYFDDNISEHEKQHLIYQLTKSENLRNRFIEYENFETLSYKVMKEHSIQTIANELENNSQEECVDISEESIELSEEINLDITEDTVEGENYNIEDGEFTELEQQESEFDENISIDEPENIIEEISEETLALENIEPLSETEEDLLSDITDDITVEMSEPSQEDMLEDLPIGELTPQEEITDNFETLQEDILSDNFTETDNSTIETIENIEETGITLEEQPIGEINDNIPETSDTNIITEELPLDNFTDLETLPEQSEEIFEELPAIETLSDDLQDISDNQENNTEEPFEINNTEDASDKDDNLFSIIDDILPDSIESVPEPAENIEDIPDISALTSEIIPDEEDNEEEITNINVNIANQPMQEEDHSEVSDISDIISNDNSNLETLYNENNTPIEEQPDLQKDTIPGIAFLQQNKLADKKVIITAALAIILTVSAFALIKMRNNKVSENPQNIPAEVPINEPSVSDTDLTVDTPEIKEDLNNSEEVKKLAQEVKTEIQTNSTPTPQAHMTVNKLVWNVPDALSYNRNVQNYLRTAGKSIKLSLSADLLLATEFAYTNQVKIGLKLSNNGAVKDARIISGSGSTQIDNIVLQSVKDTLNVVKPPSNDINASEFNLNLIIYF